MTTPPPPTLQIQVTGMTCADCVRTVEQGVQALEGVTQATANFATGSLQVVGHADTAAIHARIKALGYGVQTETTPPQPIQTNFIGYLWHSLETRLALLAGGLMLPGLVFNEILGQENTLIHITSLLALALAGWPIARSALRALWFSRQITINALMTLAAIGAVIIGAYTEAGMVIVLFALAEALEGYTAEKARGAIRGLLQLAPRTATRIQPCETHGQDFVTVAVEDLQLGDRLLIKPGERIPMDGRILAGESRINQAPITGESALIDKTPGQHVFASSINGAGTLEIEVTHLAADNTIARLIRMVEQAQAHRAPAQRWIDRFATWYTPAVVFLAGAVAVLPPLLFGQPWIDAAHPTQGWLYRGLALLVIACPCALVISTPVALISALTNAAQRGVLFKGGLHLETLSRIRTIAFDKTGTLTAGAPTVTVVQSATCTTEANCAPCDELLALASAVEARSEHPLARAVVDAAEQRHVFGRYQAADVVAQVGHGVQGMVNGQQVMLGSHRYFDQNIPHDSCATLNNLASSGDTPILVSSNGHYQGFLSLSDPLRSTSAEAIAQLRAMGIEHLVLLTGDQQATADKVAAAVGLTEVHAELLPEDKVAAIRQLQRTYGPVAMIGDGINDAPALATADVGIAIGAANSGTAQAIETAPVTLMRDDLRQLPTVLQLSRTTMQTIYFNIVLAVGLKLAFLLLAVLGYSTLWMAVMADLGASLLVTLIGMRLLRWQKPDSAN